MLLSILVPLKPQLLSSEMLWPASMTALPAQLSGVLSARILPLRLMAPRAGGVVVDRDRLRSAAWLPENVLLVSCRRQIAGRLRVVKPLISSGTDFLKTCCW